MYGWACIDTGDAEAAARFVQSNVLHSELSSESPTVRIRSLVGPGDPVRLLVAAAEDADLLVVGRRSSRLRNLLTRSVSKGCADLARCPVVVVRADLAEHRHRALALRSLPAGAGETITSEAPVDHLHRARCTKDSTAQSLTSSEAIDETTTTRGQDQDHVRAGPRADADCKAVRDQTRS